MFGFSAFLCEVNIGVVPGPQSNLVTPNGIVWHDEAATFLAGKWVSGLEIEIENNFLSVILHFLISSPTRCKIDSFICLLLECEVLRLELFNNLLKITNNAVLYFVQEITHTDIRPPRGSNGILLVQWLLLQSLACICLRCVRSGMFVSRRWPYLIGTHGLLPPGENNALVPSDTRRRLTPADERQRPYRHHLITRYRLITDDFSLALKFRVNALKSELRRMILETNKIVFRT